MNIANVYIYAGRPVFIFGQTLPSHELVDVSLASLHVQMLFAATSHHFSERSQTHSSDYNHLNSSVSIVN